MCNKPPEGWYCTREPGHEGPCACREIFEIEADPVLNKHAITCTAAVLIVLTLAVTAYNIAELLVKQ